MKIKSYYSRTVEDAIAAARSELGPDAMLMNSRKAPIQSRHLGEYEVVFATVAEGESAAETPPEASTAATSAFHDRLSSEVAELKRELEGMRRVLTRTAYGPQQWSSAPPEIPDALAALTAAEVSPEVAREIVQAAATRGTLPHSASGFQQALIGEIATRFTVEPVLGTHPNGPHIVALVGPPGSGKTTTLVKLAVTYGLAARRPVLLLSIDTYRVAAAEQLRSYAAILGLGFQVLETAGALAQAIEENRGKELILIDTPGLSHGEIEDAAGFTQFLSTRDDIDKHLVLPASMKSADLHRMVDAFEILRPRRLLFTKLDETTSFGPILNQAARTRRPLSFFTNGQRIPEDLEAVTQNRLIDLLLGPSAGKEKVA
jgi:flagellar biosynthesis protein FlhF